MHFFKHRRLFLATIFGSFLALVIILSSFAVTNAQTSTSTPTQCTGLNLTLNDNKTTYNTDELVNYTYTCVPDGYAAYVGIQLVKPDGTATTYNYASNIHTSTMGFYTTNLTPGSYTLRACFDPNCSPVTASAPFIVAAPAIASGNSCSVSNSFGCASDGNTQLYCNPSTSQWQFSQYCSTSNRTCNASSGMCKAICGDGICGIYETAADCPGYNDCPIAACTKLKVTLADNKTAYTKGDNVSYTFSCETPAGSPAANAIMKLVKPDGVVSTLLSITGATSLSQSYGFPTDDFATGAYVLKACWENACPAASTGVINFTINAPAAPTPAPTPGAGAPEPLNDEPGVWAQVDIATGQILTSAICTRSVCGINGEYHGYVPPSSWSTGAIWWPTTKRYIWQMPGQAGYGTGTFNFSTYVFTVAGGTIYNGVFTPTATPTVPITTTTTTPATPTAPTTPQTQPTPPATPQPVLPTPTPITAQPLPPTPPASSATSSLPQTPPMLLPAPLTQITPTSTPLSPLSAQKWDSRQARLMENQKKSILRELKEMERYYKRAKGNETALTEISALRNKINDFKPKDGAAFEIMQNLQDELNILRMDFLEITERETQFTQAKQSMKSLEQFLAPFKEKVKKIERGGGVVAQSFKDALSNAKEFIKRVRAAKNYEEIQDIMDQEQFARLGTDINDYLPELERLTYLPEIIRIMNKQTAEGKRLIKITTATARRLGVDITEQIQEMEALLAAMQEAAAAIKTGAMETGDIAGYIQENISDKLDNLRGIADQIRAIANVRQFINQTGTDIKKYTKRVNKLEKAGESMSMARALLDEMTSNLDELRPLAAKKIKADTVDLIISYLRAISDARDQLEEILRVVSPDVLEQQLQQLFKTSGKEFGQLGTMAIPTAAPTTAPIPLP